MRSMAGVRLSPPMAAKLVEAHATLHVSSSRFVGSQSGVNGAVSDRGERIAPNDPLPRGPPLNYLSFANTP
jgi:hypothetical protein